jgi:eukaryotic-like serine/threonine-protein kinase
MSVAHERLKEILAEAVGKETAEARAAYLDTACQGDAALRQQVEGLLAAHEQAGGFLEQPVLPPAEAPIGVGPGTVVGRYKLLEEIGEGGFGRVFMAEQQVPVHRKVALKIIKAGMDTREVIGRFEAERQALALMDHPNIARVLDAGATESGRPYFVMELVNGIPLTSYCDQSQLATEQRLQLFMKVCQAVQHAHQKGIIHRDLKPSNILVTLIDGEAVPKIIDFGVAKALGQKLTEKTLFTSFQQMIGTPAYMSPEQAALSGVDVDTRSDIYSLGVLLYELLTGVTPFDQETLRKAALDEIRRLIRETEPPKPSTRLQSLGAKITEVAQRRHIDPAALPRLVHGDLDWIAMKALEKDRARRYETVSALVEDLQRHLSHEPVHASPPSAAYRARKFIRRHRFGVAIAATLTLTLTAGLTAALIGFGQARLEWDRAERHAREETRQRQLAEANYQTAREAVDRMLTRLAADLADQPRMAQLRRKLLEDALKFHQGFLEQKANDRELRHAVAQTYMKVGDIYESLGQYDKSLEPWGRALTLLEALAQQHPSEAQYREEMATAFGELAFANMWLERVPEGVAQRRKALAIYEALQRQFPDAPEYLSLVVRAHVDVGNAFQWSPRESLEEMQQALRLCEDRRARFPNLPEDPELLAHVCHWLGAALNEVGRLEEAEQEYRKAHELRTRMVAEQPGSADLKSGLAHIKTYLGDLLAETGRLSEAEKLLREATLLVEQNLADAPDSAEVRSAGNYYNSLSQVLLAMHRTEAAEAALRRSIEMRTNMVRNVPSELLYRTGLAWSLYDLGVVLQATGRSEQAAAAFRDAIAMLEKVVAQKPDAPGYLRYLGTMLATCPAIQFRDPPRAVRLARQAVQFAPQDPACWKLLGIAQYRAGDPVAAIEALQKTTGLLDRCDAEHSLYLAMAHWQEGDRERARVWYDQAIAWIERYHPANERLDRLREEAQLLLGKEQRN